MKKSTLYLILIFLLIGFVPVSAGTFDMQKVGLSIDIPDEYYIKTDENPLTKSMMNSLADGDTELTDYIETGVSTLLTAKSQYNTLILTVSAAYSPQIRTELFPSQSEIKQLNQTGKETMALLNMVQTSSGSYKTGFAEYPYTIYRVPDAGMYIIQYSLFVDYYAITFTFVQSAPFDNASLNKVHSIMDSVKWISSNSTKSSNLSNLMGRTFNDKYSGVSFPIPSGFAIIDLSEDQCLLYNENKDVMIQYFSVDSYASLPSYMKTYITREDINASAFSEVDVAAGVGVPVRRVCKRTVGGMEYFAIQMHAEEIPAYGLDSLAYDTYRNGYEICFIYTASKDKWNYEAMDQFIKTVRYI